MNKYTVTFPDSDYGPVELDEDAPLSEALDASNSPVLFGCRTGVCGTCVCSVQADGDLPPPDEDEAEILEIYAPDTADARLACQLKLRAHCALKPVG